MDTPRPFFWIRSDQVFFVYLCTNVNHNCGGCERAWPCVCASSLSSGAVEDRRKEVEEERGQLVVAPPPPTCTNCGGFIDRSFMLLSSLSRTHAHVKILRCVCVGGGERNTFLVSDDNGGDDTDTDWDTYAHMFIYLLFLDERTDGGQMDKEEREGRAGATVREREREKEREGRKEKE